jgi:hypothetical protein
MWWRALGVGLALLAVGVIGGYAVADRTTEQPTHGTGPEPVPAVSPAVPTPPAREVLPDPLTPALVPDLPSHETTLRISRKGIGLTVQVPDGWTENRVENSNSWTYAVLGNPKNTYVLRINIMAGDHVSIPVAMKARIAAFEDAVDNGDLLDFEVTAKAEDTFEATYIDHGYLRVTMERWVSFGGTTAYAAAAVTGRTVDEEGLRDLLVRTVTSMQELPAVTEDQ